MNLVVAPNAGLPENKEMVAGLVLADHVKCILQFVQLVAKKLRFLFSPAVTVRFTAASVFLRKETDIKL
jgi:hypothetical protein